MRSHPVLQRLDADAVRERQKRREAVSADTLAIVGPIVTDVRQRGEAALRQHAEHFGDLNGEQSLFCARDRLQAAFGSLPEDQQALLQRAAERIRVFAEAQRAALQAMQTPIPAGRAGHRITPVARAGCYAPGGRFPLPSSALMTAVTARAAGVETVWLASPRPTAVTLAAGWVAGADGLIAAGGAQAIAALAYGAGPVPPSDVVVGPGNRFVTAAKFLVSQHVRIDMLAGPSELVVWADGDADAAVVAADLLAQAEHDPEALPVLVSTDASLIDAVDAAVAEQLEDLPTAATARAAVDNGFAVLAGSQAQAAELCDLLAPEHLALHVRDAKAAMQRVSCYGALFVGEQAAEVFGDYGAGPNHVLPTGGGARYSGGLSVLSFLRVATWMTLDAGPELRALAQDAAHLARLEGLEAHARAAERRLGPSSADPTAFDTQS